MPFFGVCRAFLCVGDGSEQYAEQCEPPHLSLSAIVGASPWVVAPRQISALPEGGDTTRT